jgi:hypothetical protein
MDYRRSWFEWPATRICDLLLGPPPGRARLGDRLNEAVGQRRVELATWREADVELEALWTSAARVRDLVLGSDDGPSSLAATMSMAAGLLEARIDAVATNGIHWGSHSTLLVTVSHFPKLKAELEVLGSGRSADLIADEANALWI